jgi:glycosyltransferase involved in cell wall biosynthesis
LNQSKTPEKVLILTYYWPPAGGAGVQRWAKFAKYLKSFGYEPWVVTVRPDEASYALTDETLTREIADIRTIRTRTFEPFGIYKKLLGKKEIPYAGFANETEPGPLEKISRFVRGNFFIPDARKGWNRYALPVARELIRQHNIRNLVTTSPPHSTQLAGLKLKKEFDLNWIADLRDPWTDIYYYPMMYHTSRAIKIDKRLESSVLNSADHVVVVSRSIKNLFLDKLKTGKENKIHVIPNGFDEEDFTEVKPVKNRQFTITYTGTMADNYHIETFLNTLSESGIKDFQLRFVGQVSEKYKNLIGTLELQDQTLFIPHVEHAKAIEFMVTSDLLLLAIPDVPDNEGILTGKLFEYLASGVSILGIGPASGDAAEIISQCGAGKMFDYSDNKGINDFLTKQYRAFSAGKSATEILRCRRFSRKALTAEMVKLFR